MGGQHACPTPGCVCMLGWQKNKKNHQKNKENQKKKKKQSNNDRKHCFLAAVSQWFGVVDLAVHVLCVKAKLANGRQVSQMVPSQCQTGAQSECGAGLKLDSRTVPVVVINSIVSHNINRGFIAIVLTCGVNSSGDPTYCIRRRRPLVMICPRSDC